MTFSDRPGSPLEQLVRHLDGDTLRELAALADTLNRRHFIDPERAAREYADIVAKGGRPALGWWRRHLAPAGPPGRQSGWMTGEADPDKWGPPGEAGQPPVDRVP